nr:hypothetical protein [Pandoravirus massiliensis]
MHTERDGQVRGAPRGAGLAARLVVGCVGLLAVVASATFCAVGSSRSAACALLGVPGALAKRRQRKVRLVADLQSSLRPAQSTNTKTRDTLGLLSVDMLESRTRQNSWT